MLAMFTRIKSYSSSVPSSSIFGITSRFMLAWGQLSGIEKLWPDINLFSLIQKARANPGAMYWAYGQVQELIKGITNGGKMNPPPATILIVSRARVMLYGTRSVEVRLSLLCASRSIVILSPLKLTLQLLTL